MKSFHTYSEVKHMKQDKELKYNASGYYDPTAFEALTKVQKGEEKMEVLKGDIYFMERNVKGNIPVVVVSNDIGNHFSDFVNVVYMTRNAAKPMPTHVVLECRGLTNAMCEQIHCVRKDQLQTFVRRCTEAEIEKLDAALMLSCGIKVECNELIESLQNQIECMKKDNENLHDLIDSKDEDIVSLQLDLNKANDTIENMLEAESKPLIMGVDSVKVNAERDLYKNLYEQLLEKMMCQKAG